MFLGRNFCQWTCPDKERKKNLYDVFVHFQLHVLANLSRCLVAWVVSYCLINTALNDPSSIHHMLCNIKTMTRF